MIDSTPPSPLGSLVLLGILLFIVYRILHSLSQQSRPSNGGKTAGGKVFHLPGSRPPTTPPTADLMEYVGEDPLAGIPSALESHTTLTEKVGLVWIGDYTIGAMEGYFMRSFTHPERNLVAIIYKDPKGKTWVNLVTEYKDGRVITCTSAEPGAIPQSRPRGMPLFIFPGLSTEQLIRRHKLETRGVEQAEPLPPEKFAAYFGRNYAKLRAHIYEMEDREAQKGEEREAAPPPIPEERVDTPFEAPADTEPTQMSEGFVPSKAQLRQWLEMIYDAVNVPREKRAQFQKGLIWIQDEASVNSVTETVNEYSGVTIERTPQGQIIIRSEAGAQDILEPGELKGSALFDKINQALPDGKKFTSIPLDVKGISFYSRQAV